MGSPPFVHLHVQSEYSLLRGACRLDRLVERAAELDMPAVAVTDRDALFGAAAFCRKAAARGIRPIVGAELSVVSASDGAGPIGNRAPSVAPGSGRRSGLGGLSGPERRATYPIVLLAENSTGYRNLIRLVNRACDDGYPPRRPISADDVAEVSDGLIALDGGWRGAAARLLADGRRDEARRVIDWWRAALGPDRFFVELSLHGSLADPARARELSELAATCRVRTVATNDVHYVDRRDADVVNALWSMQSGRRFDDPAAPRLPDGEFDLKSAPDMWSKFDWEREACVRTAELAERCSVDPLEAPAERARRGLLLPAFPDSSGGDSRAQLRELVRSGVQARYGSGKDEAGGIRQRMEHELSVIEAAGFADYFLIVWDVVQYAKRRRIPVGPGRGSAAASLVAYALGITEVDPLRYDLIFERFLNPGRKTPPDIDLDFAPERRGEIVAYIAEKYGKDRVAHIGTFGTLAERAAIREAGRLLGMPGPDIDRVVEERRSAAGRFSKPAFERVADLARRLEGLPRHLSVHAAGIVIAPHPLDRSVPTVGGGDAGVRITQYPMDDIEAAGLLKVDLLGLRTLSVIYDAVRRVERRTGDRLDPNGLPLDDAKVYQMLARGETAGVFQLETPMFRKILPRLKPSRFEDIIAALALGRPGPMDRFDEYVRRKDGKEPTPRVHPIVDAILKPTYGSLLYQEQVMRLATEVAGYAPGEADQLRRAMGKKKKDEMEAERTRFLRGAKARSFPTDVAKELFEQIARFAEYAFNVAHSAAYARVTYATAYLRCHYPAEFMAAELTSVIGSAERLQSYVDECRRMGLRVLHADVNESGVEFEIEEGAIRTGLASVKHVGRRAAEALVEARRTAGPFESWQALVGAVDRQRVGHRALQSLIDVGAVSFPFDIEIDVSGQYDEELQRVAALVKQHPGKVAVRLRLRDGKTGRRWTLSLGREWRVDPTGGFAEQLERPTQGAMF